MRKIWFVCAALLCAIILLAPAALAEETGYVERPTKVITDGEEVGELVLRFYDAAPNVAYMGIGTYSAYMKGRPLALRDNGDGTCALVNDIGAALICDAEAGRITAQDWNLFFDEPLPIESALGYRDSCVPFLRLVDVTYEGEAKPVTLNLAKYGIRVYADRDDVYLPLSTLTNIMTDIDTNHLLYNGENLYAGHQSIDPSGIEGFFDTGWYRAWLQGAERPADIVRQCYADLCFTFDTL